MALVLLIVFVVAMMIWFFCGYTVTQPTPPGWALAGNSFIPWLCVAILGYFVFVAAMAPTTTLPR